MSKQDMDIIKTTLRIERELFYSDESNFGIYGAVPINEEEAQKVKLNNYGNVSIKGVVPRLEIGGEYITNIVEKMDKRYGLGYEVKSIYQDVPQSVEEQREYLSTLLTPLQVKNIYDVYEGQDIIGMMKDGTFDYNKVKGLGEVTYNNVKSKVLENIELQEALVELSKYGLNYNMVSKLVSKYGSASLLIEKIEKNPYILSELQGIGFKKCDELALEMGIEKTSEYRINACVKHILNEESSKGHSWISQSQLKKNCEKLLKIDVDYILEFLAEYDKDDLHFEGQAVALSYIYKQERDIFRSINRLLNSKPSFEVENIDQRIKDAEKSQGFEFTDEQRQAIKQAVTNNILVISGKAGTGKTTILKGIIEVFGEKRSYSACALSGKASQRITEGTGLDASTIHRLLGFDGFSEGFTHDLDFPLPSDVVVLDEASMVNSSIFNSLISAVKSGSKFIIIGDVEQLEAIGSGNVLKDMIDSGIVPTANLTKVHRQALKSGILSTANEVREGIQFNDEDNFENRVIGDLKDLHFKPYRRAESVKKSIIKLCKQYKKSNKFDIMNFQVIVPMKNRGEASTKNLNIELQEIFNGDPKPHVKHGDYMFKKGDKVIHQGNNYDDNIYNGTLGTIVGVNESEKKLTINFMGKTVEYDKDKIGKIDMAYALTVHKVQGSQFDNVIVGFDYSSYILLSRQLVYTALTRASKRCILTCQNDALIHAIRTDKSSKRNTFLLDMLKGA